MSSDPSSSASPAVFYVCTTPSRHTPWKVSQSAAPTGSTYLDEIYRFALAPDVRTDKDGPCIAPVRLAPPLPSGMYVGYEEKPTATPYLVNANVAEVSLVFVDLDKVTQTTFDAVVSFIESKGLRFVAFPTWSYGKDGTVSWRIVLELDRPVPLKHPSQWSGLLWPQLMRFLGLDPAAAIKADKACKDARRLHYLPSWDVANPVARPAPLNVPGKPISVTQVLGGLLALPYLTGSVPLPGKDSEDSAPAVDVESSELFRRALRHFKTDTKYRHVLELARDGKSLRDRDNARHPALMDLTWAMACVAKPGESDEDLLAVASASFNAMSREEPGRDFEAEALKALAFNRKRRRDTEREREAKAAAEKEEARVRLERLREADKALRMSAAARGARS